MTIAVRGRWDTALVITIRRAVTGDGPILTGIDLLTWTPQTSPSPYPHDPSGYRFFDRRTRPEDVLVAEVDSVIGGYVKLREPSGLAARLHVYEISGLAVAPELQGAGVGRRLVEAGVGESRRRGARKLALRVLGDNAAARHLDETCRFTVEGVLQDEFFLDGHYVDDVLMACHLAPAAAAANCRP